MRILIISFQFPPFKGAGCLRVGKTAKYLSRFGHDVRVISARDQNVPTPTLPVEIDASRVTYSKWIDLTRLGAGRRAGVADPSENEAGAASERAERTPYGFKARLRKMARAVLLFPDREIGWLPFGRAAALGLTRSWRPDVIVGSAYPITSLLVAWTVSKATGIPWVAEMRDLWADFPHYQFPEWRRRIEKRFERRVLRSAAGIVTVSEPLAKLLFDEYQKPTAVVYHGFDPDDYVTATTESRADDPLRLVYTGNVYKGVQDPTPLFEALVPLAGNVRLEMYGSRQPWVERIAVETGAASFVDFKGVVSHADALTAQVGADLLVSFLWTDITQPGMLLTKNLEYFGAGRPILGVGPRENGASDLIEGRGAGKVLQTRHEIRNHLDEMLGQKRRLGAVPGILASAQEGLSREAQTRKLEGFLLSIVPGVA